MLVVISIPKYGLCEQYWFFYHDKKSWSC